MNAAHKLIWSSTALAQHGSFLLLVVEHGPWFWVHTAFSYLLLGGGSILIVFSLARHKQRRTGQAATLLLAVLLPWVGNILYLSGISGAVDLTPFCFALTGSLLALSIFRFHLFDLSSVARAAVVERMRDAVVVLDTDGFVTDNNPAASALLGAEVAKLHGAHLSALLNGQMAGVLTGGTEAVAYTLSHGNGAARRDLDLHLSPLHDTRDRLVGRLLVARDVTAVRHAEEAQRKLNALIEYSQDFIGMATMEGQVIYINGYGCNLVGLADLAAAQRYAMDEVLVAEDRAQFLAQVVPYVLREGAWTGVMRFHHFGGDLPIPMRLNVFLVREGQSGVPVAFATVSRDIREEQRLADLRDNLTHTMVHDLRDPLTAIQSAFDILSYQGGLDEKTQELVGLGKRGARRMLGLVTAILDLSRLESGQMPLRHEALNISTVTQEIFALLGTLASAKGLRLAVEARYEPPSAWADQGLVSRVLQNLTANAIKYSPEGGQLAVAIEAWPDNPAFVLVSILDEGPGVPPELHSRLFQKFATGPNRDTGSGLGLAFCKLAVEAHGGQIWYAPRPAGGTAIHFTLPACQVSAQQ